MDPIADAEVCADADSNSCDLVYQITGDESLARAAEWVIGKPLSILLLLLLAFVARWLLHRLIDRLAGRAASGVLPTRFGRGRIGRSGARVVAHGGHTNERREQRAKAMGSLLKSIVTGVIFAMVIVMILAELEYNVGPILASAGILGIALGFGAQSLVGDFLAGISMILEDQYGVGDVIDVGEAVGTVEAVSLRVTRLRDIDGTVWYVRNGEILRVGNQSQNWARTVLDIGVGYGEDLQRVQRILREVAHDLWEDEDFKNIVIEEPEVWGVQSLDPDGVLVRVTLKTAPLEQWAVARVMRERVKARFDFEGIEIPFPQRVVWQRDVRDAKSATQTGQPPGAGAGGAGRPGGVDSTGATGDSGVPRS